MMLNTIFGVSHPWHTIHIMSCRVYVVFHSFKLTWAPKLEDKVESGMVDIKSMRTKYVLLLESIMNIVEKTYMITLYIYTRTCTLTTTSCKFPISSLNVNLIRQFLWLAIASSMKHFTHWSLIEVKHPMLHW